MFNNQEINEEDKEYFKTLNKDILLSQSSNNLWDFSWNEHDLNEATELDSLQCGIINACLTSWNYMNRYGNPTYAEYGNRAYLQLKQNKSSMNTYKIKVFFEEVLERMRRVYLVEDLTVKSNEENYYAYDVYFSVVCVNDEIVKGSFTISANKSVASSYVDLNSLSNVASIVNPLMLDFKLYNEFGSGISDEVLYLYLDDSFIGITSNTNRYGLVSYDFEVDSFNPSLSIGNHTLKYVFKGNSSYGEFSNSFVINVVSEKFSTGLDLSVNYGESSSSQKDTLIARLYSSDGTLLNDKVVSFYKDNSLISGGSITTNDKGIAILNDVVHTEGSVITVKFNGDDTYDSSISKEIIMVDSD